MKKALATLGALLLALLPVTAQNRNILNGVANAGDFAYGLAPGAPALAVSATSGTCAGGSSSCTLTLNYGYTNTSSGITFNPLSTTAPIAVGLTSNYEVVTPSAVSCPTPQLQGTCQVTFTAANAHGPGDLVRSGSYGLQEALNYMSSKGGGQASLDVGWTALGGTNATINAAIVVPGTAIDDNRSINGVYWNPGPTASTAMAVPTTLTALTALPSATPAGSYTTGTYHLCISYVDVMGNEGSCSADFSEAGVATGSFIFSPPAASSGAVGYTIYISLVSGAYTAMYHVPLSSSICTLTALETVTPACAVTNSTYGQVGATATVTALTVNTAQLAMNNAVIGTSTVVHGNAIAKTTYGYVSGTKLGTSGIQPIYFPATGAAATSTNLNTLASLAVPAGFWQVGKTIRVCGNATMSGASTATISGVDLIWDADGQNTAGAPVIVSTNSLTTTLSATVVQYQFCQTLTATVIGTTVTGGTLLAGPGSLFLSTTSAGTAGYGGPVTTVGTTGSLNLLSAGRLHVAFVHTTGTDGAATILQGLTVEVL